MQLTKRTLSFAFLALSSIGVSSAADLGVSITLAQPGVYGRIDLGGAPPPPVIVQRPVLIQQGGYAPPPPVYLYVPVDHQRHWRRHCAEYHACGVPVYFVKEDWYHREYEPRFAHPEARGGEFRGEEGRREEGRREGDRRDGGERRGEDRGEGRRERGDDRR